MKASWVIAAAMSVGSLVAACGSSGSASSSVAGGSGGSGASSGTTTANGGAVPSGGASTTSGGFVFDAGGLDGSSGRDGDACGSMALTSSVSPGNIVVVFDQSDSMSQAFDNADGGSAGAKYKVAEDALTAALAPQEARLSVGAIFFPTGNTGGTTCDATEKPIGTAPQIAIEPGKQFITDFEGHFSATGWTLILGTPTVLALQAADTALPDPAPLKGQRAVVILTDGAPTCDTVEADILAPIEDMFTRDIKTYVIGLPGSATAKTLLDAMAMAGGTTSYLSPSDPTALETALAQITSSTIDQCTISLTSQPPDLNEVYLIATDPENPGGVEIPRTDGGDGWTLSADGTTATLTGNVCTTAQSGGYTTLQFVYGCPSLPQ
jgi:hypothetical protein